MSEFKHSRLTATLIADVVFLPCLFDLQLYDSLPPNPLRNFCFEYFKCRSFRLLRNASSFRMLQWCFCRYFIYLNIAKCIVMNTHIFFTCDKSGRAAYGISNVHGKIVSIGSTANQFSGWYERTSNVSAVSPYKNCLRLSKQNPSVATITAIGQALLCCAFAAGIHGCIETPVCSAIHALHIATTLQPVLLQCLYSRLYGRNLLWERKI